MFDNFVSFYTASYGASSEEQERIKQKLQDNMYAVRFDPAFFLLMFAQDHNSAAMYAPELKTMFFPDMKTYRNIEISLHEIIHSFGSIDTKSDGSKIENYTIYKALNEGITEKMTVEMTGKKKEEYSPNVKCTQIIDAITDGKLNEAFQENDVNKIKEAYDEQVSPGAFEELVYKIHGVENTFREINKANITAFKFEEENNVNSTEFIKQYYTIKKIIDEEENLRLNYLKERIPESKEKYLIQSDKTDKALKEFKDQIVDYVFAKECLSKYDNGKNLDLICDRLASVLNKHFSIIINKSSSDEDQMKMMQKICNIQASFDFSENKINVLLDVIKENMFKLYRKITQAEPLEDLDVYKELGIKHNLKWLNNARADKYI